MFEDDSDIAIIDDQDLDIIEPGMFNCIMLNDNYTTFNLVELVLVTIFHKNQQEAKIIADKIHKEQKAIVGTYTQDIAETKRIQAIEIAKKVNMPLRITIEKC